MSLNKNNIHLKVGSSPDEFSFDDAVTAYMDTMNGFVFSILQLCFKPHVFELMYDDLLKEFPGEIKTLNYDRSGNSIFRKHLGEEIRIYVSGNKSEYYVNIFSKTEENNHKIWKLYKKHVPVSEDVDIFTHSFFMSNNDIESNSGNIKSDELSYITNSYYPYINTELMFDQFFTGTENILLFVGEPGLGKSKMATLAIKHALENTDKLPYDKLIDNPCIENQYITVVFVKSTDVLSNDKFWRKMEKLKPDFVIIDDLDFMLTKRDSEVTSGEDVKKNEFLNQFLSHTDGVERYNTKFIITTNQSYSDIDTALLRKGRLFDIIELRKLTKEEALIIWTKNNLDEGKFKELFKSDYVLPAELGSEINKRLNDRIKNSTESYLYEDNISKVKKASRTKIIGL